jgi:large subunit ribosomal protein L5
MATTEKEKKPKAEGGAKAGSGQPAAGGDSKGKGKGKKKEAGEYKQAAHAGVGLPVPPPRLKKYYEATVRNRLKEQFGYKNLHEIPTVSKIVLNCGMGEAIKNPKILDKVVEELAIISGQRPVRRKAKKSIANFGQREGQEIGAAVTLRGARMWEFMDRFITVAIPRIRDFRGVNTRSFDGRGNYSLGVKEQMIFPEINYDMVEQIHGMDITFVTTTNRDDQAFALLRELGMPFKGDDKPIIVED